MSRAVDELESLLDQYWNLAFQEGQTGVSQGSKANEVLHALRMNHHAVRAEALREAADKMDEEIHDVTDPVRRLRAMAAREEQSDRP